MEKNTTAAVSGSALRGRAAAVPAARLRAASARRPFRAACSPDPDELFIQEILRTFGPRWEW